jgi:hypothetical protein
MPKGEFGKPRAVGNGEDGRGQHHQDAAMLGRQLGQSALVVIGLLAELDPGKPAAPARSLMVSALPRANSARLSDAGGNARNQQDWTLARRGSGAMLLRAGGHDMPTELRKSSSLVENFLLRLASLRVRYRLRLFRLLSWLPRW